MDSYQQQRDRKAHIGPYLGSKEIKSYHHLDDKHTPFTKRPGEVKSLMYVDIRTHPRGDFIEMSMMETTNGRSRTLTATFYKEDAELLRQYLNQLDAS